MQLKTYEQVSEYISKIGFPNPTDRIVVVQEVLDRLGNPHEGIRFVQIGGTKGKGSTGCLLGSILRSIGFTTGWFHTPSIASYHDQTVLNGVELSEEEFVDIFHIIKSVVPDKYLNYLVFQALISIYAISRYKPDFGILEVGIGGITDPTCAIDPEALIITNIEREHELVLGFGLERVAKAKSTLIRNGVPTVLGIDQSELLPIFSEQALKGNSQIYLLNKDFSYESCEKSFNYMSSSTTLSELNCSLVGRQNFSNASLAIFTLELLSVFSDSFESCVRNGLTSASFGGRFEYLQRSPDIIYDVAHTPRSCEFLAENILDRYDRSKVTILLSYLKSQIYWKEMVKILSRCCYRIIASPIYFYPGRDMITSTEIYREAQKCGVVAEKVDDVVSGFFDVSSKLASDDVLILGCSTGVRPISQFYKGKS
jgi:dihydrofolate synthase / folylpolyglutamate synthase